MKMTIYNRWLIMDISFSHIILTAATRAQPAYRRDTAVSG